MTNSAYNKYFFNVITPEGDIITSNLQITVSDPDTGVEDTLYSDMGTTSYANSITSTVFDALGDGNVSFYSELSSVDLFIMDVTSRKSKYIRGFTPMDNHVVFDKGLFGSYTTSSDYVIPEQATGLTLTIETMADTSNDDAALGECTLIKGSTVTTINIGDYGTATVGRATAIVNRSGVTITADTATADNDINGVTDAVITLYPDGWVMFAEIGNDVAIITGGQGYSLASGA